MEGTNNKSNKLRKGEIKFGARTKKLKGKASLKPLKKIKDEERGSACSLSCLSISFQGLLWWLTGKESTCQCKRQEMQVQSLGQEDPLEKEMVTHSSILAWKVLQTEDPGGLQSMGSQKSQTYLSD